MKDFISICLLYFTNCIYYEIQWYDFLSSEKTNNCNLSIISLPWPLFLDHYFLSFQLIPSVIPILSKFYAYTPEAEHSWRKMCNCIDCSYFKFRAKNLKVDPEFCSAIIEHFPGLLSLHSSVRLSHLFFSPSLNTSPVAFPFSWHPCFLLYWEP